MLYPLSNRLGNHAGPWPVKLPPHDPLKDPASPTSSSFSPGAANNPLLTHPAGSGTNVFSHRHLALGANPTTTDALQAFVPQLQAFPLSVDGLYRLRELLNSIPDMTPYADFVMGPLFEAMQNPRHEEGVRYPLFRVYLESMKKLKGDAQVSAILCLESLLTHELRGIRVEAVKICRLLYRGTPLPSNVSGDCAKRMLLLIEHENTSVPLQALYLYGEIVSNFDLDAHAVTEGACYFRKRLEKQFNMKEWEIYCELVPKCPPEYAEVRQAMGIARRYMGLSDELIGELRNQDTRSQTRYYEVDAFPRRDFKNELLQSSSKLYKVLIPKLTLPQVGQELPLMRSCYMGEAGQTRDMASSAYNDLLECASEKQVEVEAPVIREAAAQRNSEELWREYRFIVLQIPESIFFDEIEAVNSFIRANNAYSKKVPFYEADMDSGFKDRLAQLLWRRRFSEEDDRLFQDYQRDLHREEFKCSVQDAIQEREKVAKNKNQKSFTVRIDLQRGTLVPSGSEGDVLEVSFVREHGAYFLDMASAQAMKAAFLSLNTPGNLLHQPAYRGHADTSNQNRLGSLLGIREYQFLPRISSYIETLISKSIPPNHFRAPAFQDPVLEEVKEGVKNNLPPFVNKLLAVMAFSWVWLLSKLRRSPRKVQPTGIRVANEVAEEVSDGDKKNREPAAYLQGAEEKKRAAR